MYTALQHKALTQAIRFEHFKNPVHFLLLQGPATWWVLWHHLAHLQYWWASLGLIVLQCNHCTPCALPCSAPLLQFVSYGWVLVMVATGAVVGDIAVSVDNCEPCAPFNYSSNKWLPLCYFHFLIASDLLGCYLTVPSDTLLAWSHLLSLVVHVSFPGTYPLPWDPLGLQTVPTPLVCSTWCYLF